MWLTVTRVHVETCDAAAVFPSIPARYLDGHLPLDGKIFVAQKCNHKVTGYPRYR